MNEITIFTAVFMSFLLLLVQRSEKKARRMGLILTSVVFIMIRHVAIGSSDEGSAWGGLLIALLFNFAFWFLIGRYNSPRSSDEIQVLGMDD